MYLEGVSLEFSTTKGGETTLTPIMGTLSQGQLIGTKGALIWRQEGKKPTAAFRVK